MTKNPEKEMDRVQTQHLRKANGMTQEELAVKLDTSDRHLRNDLHQIFFLQIEFRQLCLVI